MRGKLTVKRAAFTLIELLIVIAIMGVLAALIIASIANSRVKAADANLKGSLHSINLTLEQYKNDNSFYPSSTTQIPASPMTVGAGFTAANAPALVNAISPLFLANTNASAFKYPSVTVGYKTTANTSYIVAAGLCNTTEATPGLNNGEYLTNDGGNSGQVAANSLTLTNINCKGTNSPTGHAWVVYGPQ